MTTVGYGDLVPESWQGRLFAGLTAVWGIILIALPVAVIGKKKLKNNFFELFNRQHLLLYSKYFKSKDPTLQVFMKKRKEKESSIEILNKNIKFHKIKIFDFSSINFF